MNRVYNFTSVNFHSNVLMFIQNWFNTYVYNVLVIVIYCWYVDCRPRMVLCEPAPALGCGTHATLKNDEDWWSPTRKLDFWFQGWNNEYGDFSPRCQLCPLPLSLLAAVADRTTRIPFFPQPQPLYIHFDHPGRCWKTERREKGELITDADEIIWN